MTDARLRTLERRWTETGSPADHAVFLRECVRVGRLAEATVRAAAWIGHPAARLALGLEPWDRAPLPQAGHGLEPRQPLFVKQLTSAERKQLLREKSLANHLRRRRESFLAEWGARLPAALADAPVLGQPQCDHLMNAIHALWDEEDDRSHPRLERKVSATAQELLDQLEGARSLAAADEPALLVVHGWGQPPAFCLPYGLAQHCALALTRSDRFVDLTVATADLEAGVDVKLRRYCRCCPGDDDYLLTTWSRHRRLDLPGWAKRQDARAARSQEA